MKSIGLTWVQKLEKDLYKRLFIDALTAQAFIPDAKSQLTNSSTCSDPSLFLSAFAMRLSSSASFQVGFSLLRTVESSARLMRPLPSWSNLVLRVQCRESLYRN